MQQFADLMEAQTLALAVIDALVDPFVVLDDEVRVVAASRSFYETFSIEADAAHGQSLYALCNGAWDLPALRQLFVNSVPTHKQIDGFEINVRLPGLGDRTLCLNARAVASAGDARRATLVVIKDITERRQIEAERQSLLAETQAMLRQQRLLMKEMQHRVANSLQIIASILMLKAKAVASPETREHLLDAQQRVISVGEVQAQLDAVEGIDQIDVRAYLTKLCHGLSTSMTGPANPIEIQVVATEGTVTSASAVSFGLIVTELVINSIKYAFPAVEPAARIVVSYEATEQVWRLSVSDNGIGQERSKSHSGGGLGTAIIAALAKQLDAQISRVSNDGGLTISLSGTLADAKLPLAA